MTEVFCSFPPPRLPSGFVFGCVPRFGNIQVMGWWFCNKPGSLAQCGAKGTVSRYPAQPFRF